MTHPIFWVDWIEALTGFEPDQNDGTVEWLVVIGSGQKGAISPRPEIRSAKNFNRV